MTILNFLEEPQQLQNKLMKQSSLMRSQKKKPNLLLKSLVIQHLASPKGNGQSHKILFFIENIQKTEI